MDCRLRCQSSMYLVGYRERKRTNHVHVRYDACRQAVCNGEIKLEYLTSTKMMGDTLTNALGLKKFKTMKDMTPMMVPIDENMQ